MSLQMHGSECGGVHCGVTDTPALCSQTQDTISSKHTRALLPPPGRTGRLCRHSRHRPRTTGWTQKKTCSTQRDQPYIQLQKNCCWECWRMKQRLQQPLLAPCHMPHTYTHTCVHTCTQGHARHSCLHTKQNAKQLSNCNTQFQSSQGTDGV